MDRAEKKKITFARCREMWERLYPDVKKPETYFRRMYEEAVGKGEWVLDAGCGAGGAVEHTAGPAAGRTIGIDADFESLKRNANVDFKVVASADKLPFRDGVFGAVVSQYVIEHLENPCGFFAESGRASRPGAAFIFMTTNSGGYLGAVLRLIPEGLQATIKKRFLGMAGGDIHPVRMRANTAKRLEKGLVSANYETPDFVFVGGPFYFAFSLAAFSLAVFAEKLTDGKFRHKKFYIIGKAKKNRPGSGADA